MIFLNPAVLLGMLAASIPLLIHLLNLRKLRKVEFSTLSFLKDIQKTNIRRIKLKQWILLALRMLIIAAIVASFARPALKDTKLGGASSSAKTSAVFVIDNSFSMSRIEGEGSLLNTAKAAALRILEKFQRGDEIALISTSTKFNSERFIQDKSTVMKAFDKIEISNESRSLESAVRKAFKILRSSVNINKEIYLFTDLQRSSIYQSKSTPNAGKLPDGIKLYSVILDDTQTRNFAVTDINLENQIFELGKTIGVSTVVSNLSTEGESASIAFLYINGKRRAQQSVTLRSGDSRVVSFETELKERGLLKFMVELEEDEITADNRRFVSVEIPEKINLAFFTDEKSNFLEIILEGNLLSGNLNLSKFNSRQFPAVELGQY